MNKKLFIFIAALLVSSAIHFGVLFLSFSLDEPEEIEQIIPVFEMVDAVIVEEPVIQPPPPEPEPEVIEEINDAVIPEEEAPEPEPEPQPDPPPPEPEPVTTTDNNASESSIQNDEASNFIPFYRVEKRPEFITRARLNYPLQAKRRKIEGTVIIEADIDEYGVLQRINTVKGAGFGFDEAAEKMLKESTFRPAVMDGRNVGVRMRFTIQFTLKNS